MKIKLLLVTLIPMLGFSQKVKWEQTLGSTHAEYLFDVLPTADYGFLLAGSSLSNEGGDIKAKRRGNIDAWLWKMKEDGTQEWQYRLGGDGNDYLHSICHTPDGGFLLGITSTSGKSGDKTEVNKGKEDLWLVKLNAAKTIEWQKSYGGIGTEEVVKVIALKGGDYAVLANSNSVVSGDKTQAYYGGMDLWILRLNAQGSIVWQKSYGGEYKDTGVDIIETADRGLLIGAQSNSPRSHSKTAESLGGMDYWLIKLSASEKEEWQKTYGGQQEDELREVQQLTDGSYALFGMSNSDVSGTKTSKQESNLDYWLIKTDDRGDVVKEFTYSYGDYNVLTNGFVDSKGQFFLGGSSMAVSEKQSTFEYLGTRIESDHSVAWEKSISSKGNDILTKVIQTRDGGYVFAGTSNGEKSKVKAAQKGGNDFWIVKVEKEEKEKEEPTRITLEAFPNPTTGFANIVMNFAYTTGKMEVYDLGGRLLQSRAIEYQTEPVDLTALSRGTYIIWVKTDTESGSINVVRR
ncbi:T9SS type A sorting domain-containing protein [Myroides sp. 1354]|uniref:T9SS type A sorting domain-containing protein n=1 Tax=unclassified Myroides TaxID=2642485 RepID=UPI0025773D00|nr:MULTISPECIES: T9SS type A sorting domain-containing protein [unclassified Myroides]MDM1045943.1 T9SS type A sorting domain-containing protein [Myroides sp. R163-1]MDM1056953.1 T9SS type A sorting domain-containing protein [Myroides sp. 1354]MDM1070148.1 T9SS type A sorting domain-containing protein [Myroides sp. 1372]